MSAIDGLLDDAATCENCYIDESAARAELAAMREELALWKSKHGRIERSLEAEKKLRRDDNSTSYHTFLSQSAKIDRLMEVIAMADALAEATTHTVLTAEGLTELDLKLDAYYAARESVK